MGIGASVASVALGARVIEKHFTLNRADGGVDSTFSMEPGEMKSLVIESERAFLAIGEVQYGIQPAEEKSLRYKRSIYCVKDIAEDEEFTTENIKSKRPAFGLHTRHYEEVLGRKAKVNIKKGTPLSFEIIA
jgi:N-acetylneuraminate synthase